MPGEGAAAYEALLHGPARRYRPAPADELAVQLVQRLTSVMWRQQRADRLDTEVLAQLEQRHDPGYLGGYVPGSRLAWGAARFSAVQRQQGRLDRAFSRLLDELGRLEPALEEAGESRNEPDADAVAERLRAEGRVKPVDDCPRAMLAGGGSLGGA
jgi:hypothetical protein